MNYKKNGAIKRPRRHNDFFLEEMKLDLTIGMCVSIISAIFFIGLLFCI